MIELTILYFRLENLGDKTSQRLELLNDIISKGKKGGIINMIFLENMSQLIIM